MTLCWSLAFALYGSIDDLNGLYRRSRRQRLGILARSGTYQLWRQVLDCEQASCILPSKAFSVALHGVNPLFSVDSVVLTQHTRNCFLAGL